MGEITPQKYTIEDLRGTKINKLTILEEGGKVKEGKKNRRTMICQCDCGNTKTIKLIPLMRGDIKSCGSCHENIIGKRNGYLEALEHLGSDENNQRVLKVKCHNCDSEVEMITTKFNNKTHCGCIKKPPVKKQPKPIEVNVIRGIFEIKQELEKKSEGGNRMVLAKCTKCGAEHELVHRKIKTKDNGQGCTKCYSTKRSHYRGRPKMTKEEKSLTTKYNNMYYRCYQEHHKDFKNYGGRGITICDSWLHNKSEFLKWGISNGFELGLEIDREDNEGDYTPNNCRWVTKRQNGRNTRQVKLTERDVWEIRYGKYKEVSIHEISSIFNCSWSAIKAVLIFKSWKDITIDYFDKL